MNVSPTARQLFVATLMLAATAASPLLAQHYQERAARRNQDGSPLVKQMEAAIGQVALDYWTPKLNSYKIRVDQTLSTEDLAALNRLRVRWAVLIDDGMKKYRDGVENKGAGDGYELDMKIDEEAMAKLGETMEIYDAAKEIAERYRPSFDRLGASVVEDATAFVGDVAERTDRFASENSAAIQKDGEARAMLEKRGELKSFAADIRSEKRQEEFRSVYTFALEPLVLLYDGIDLHTLFQSAGPIAKPISGITLPESSTLKQNFPNPASSTTRIVYALTGPSSRTIITIYDARGGLVASYDQGSLDAGEHALDVDVSKLATGSYLYHLSVQSPGGERVYSKTMQVIR
jgi:hypothetical protein